MVERIERKYAPVATQVGKESRRRYSEFVQHPSKETKSTWFKTYPLSPQHMQQALEQHATTSARDDAPKVDPQAVQDAPIATMGISCAEEAETEGERLYDAMGVEHESPDGTSSIRERYQRIESVSSSLASQSIGAETTPPRAYVPPHRRLARVKTENVSPEEPNLDMAHDHPSDTSGKLRSPIRVPSPVAEQFYRSVAVKTEEGGKLPKEKEVPPQDQDPSKPLRDQSTHPRDAEVKLQKSSHEYYIPTGASDSSFLAQSGLSCTARAPDSTSPPNDGIRQILTESISPLDVNFASSTLRPGTELSYLKPLTPTPFSTPYGFINPSPYAANLHFVSGSLLEGMRRRTRWGDRARLLKQTKLVTQAQCEVPIERLCGVEFKEESVQEEKEHQTKTCAWYKLPFCTCCKWSMTVIPQNPNTFGSGSYVEPVGVLREGHTARRRSGDVLMSSAVIPGSKGLRKRKWWQFRQRNHRTDNETKTRLIKRSTPDEPEGDRVPLLNPRRRAPPHTMTSSARVG
jgi:hypothetical protein